MAVKTVEETKDSAIQAKESEIAELKAKQNNWENEKRLALSEAEKNKSEALGFKDNEIAELKAQREHDAATSRLEQDNLKSQYEAQLKAKDEEVQFYKDFKAKQSTKMIGESLEIFCQNEFNKLRPTAFHNAYFEKDNLVSGSGSKGDFIFRDFEDGVEYVSIMFEMKNEADETATKHRNEDFFKELDKDRNEKKCEYAVLVSLLESDNELYNNGIVDVSYRYPKMFVIRPQFFIPIISLLRNAALNSLEYQKKLAEVQNQQLDLYNFESDLARFKMSFAESFRKASDRFGDAIKGIDSTISALTKIRENLVKSENHLNSANNKLEDISIKKLTKNAPTVRTMFEEIKAGDQ